MTGMHNESVEGALNYVPKHKRFSYNNIKDSQNNLFSISGKSEDNCGL
jgi:hypothetical protein